MTVAKDIPCNICGGNSYNLLFKARDLNYGTTDEEFNIVRCNKCGLVYINPQPKNIELYYPKTYDPHNLNLYISFKPSLQKKLELFYDYPTGNKRFRNKSINKFKYFHKFLEIKLKNDFFFYKIPYNSDKKILDIGCGNGSYLLYLKKLGWDSRTQLYGVEFPNKALKQLKEVEQINIIEGNFLERELPANFFDVVTLRHTLEHMSDPLFAMKKIFNVLKPDGKVLILVPNFKSIEALLLFKEKWYNIDAPRHLYHFTPKTLKELLNKAGFVVERICLKKSVRPVIKSLEHYGYHVPRFIEKSVIPYILKLFKIMGFSEDLLCRAVKK